MIDREKHEIGVPIGYWYPSILGENAFKVLKEFRNNTDYLNWDEVGKLFKSNQTSKTWPLLSLPLCYNHYIRTNNL